MAEHTGMDDARWAKMVADRNAVFDRIEAKLEALLQLHNLSLNSFHGAVNSVKEIPTSESLKVALPTLDEFIPSTKQIEIPSVSAENLLVETMNPVGDFICEVMDIPAATPKTSNAVTESFGSRNIAGDQCENFPSTEPIEKQSVTKEDSVGRLSNTKPFVMIQGQPSKREVQFLQIASVVTTGDLIITVQSDDPPADVIDDDATSHGGLSLKTVIPFELDFVSLLESQAKISEPKFQLSSDMFLDESKVVPVSIYSTTITTYLIKSMFEMFNYIASYVHNKVYADKKQGISSSIRFLEYLDKDKIHKVYLYENGTIATVEAVAPELGNRLQRLKVQFSGLSSGTGNTLLAKAIVSVPFISILGFELVGIGASCARVLFKKAKENAPCIFLFDEFDTSVSRDVIAMRTPGFTGTDLASLLNEAAILVGHRGIDDSNDKIVKRMGGTLMTSEKSNSLVAYHEVGHAICGTLTHGDQALGITWFIPYDDPTLISKQLLFTKIVGGLAGKGGLKYFSVMVVVTISIAYSLLHQQFKAPNQPAVVILVHQSHQHRLMPTLASFYAILFSTTNLEDKYSPIKKSQDEELVAAVHAILACFKASTMAYTAKALTTSKGACRGNGYAAVERVGNLRNTHAIFKPMKGDNLILRQQIAADLLNQYQRQFKSETFTMTWNYFSESKNTYLSPPNPAPARREHANHVPDPIFQYAESHVESINFSKFIEVVQNGHAIASVAGSYITWTTGPDGSKPSTIKISWDNSLDKERQVGAGLSVTEVLQLLIVVAEFDFAYQDAHGFSAAMHLTMKGQVKSFRLLGYAAADVQWDPGDDDYFFHIKGSLQFKQWDPGGYPFIRYSWNDATIT